MFIEQVPEIVRFLFPKALWRMNPDEKAVYLTFDDGPIPIVTPWVVDLLKKYDIKATFFVVGKNAENYPDILRQTVEYGHEIGNHTYSHPHLQKMDAN